MQVSVQKLTSTTWPRSSPGPAGSVLSHPVAPPRDGMRRRSWSMAGASPRRRRFAPGHTLDDSLAARSTCDARSMPVATPEQYAEMLDRALAGGYAFPAVNVTSSQVLNGILRGFVEARSDGIVQVTVGGAKYLGGGNALAGARAFAAMAHELAAPLDVL